MENIKNMPTEQLLGEVNNAINTVLLGGQSYKIGSQQLTRADLAQLRVLRKELEAELSAKGSDGLLDNVVVAVFDGR